MSGCSAAAYIVGYGMFAVAWHSWPPFALVGTGIGLAETAESALVASLLPDRLRGSGFGLLGGVQSAGDCASSATVGLLLAAVSPLAGFGYGAGWMVLAVLGTASPRLRACGAARKELT